MIGRSRPAVAVLLAVLASHGQPAHAAPWKFQRVSTTPAVRNVTDVAIDDSGNVVVSVGLLGASTGPLPPSGDSLPQVVAYDARTKRSTHVSKGFDGKPANGYTADPSITGDGRYVLYYSRATNLLKSDTNGAGDMFLYDLRTRRTSVVSVNYKGKQFAHDSGRGTISRDGSTVVYEGCGPMTKGSKTPPGECGLYARKLRGGQPIPLTADKAGNMKWGYQPSLSRDGRYAVFTAAANAGLTPDSPTANYYSQVYVFDTVKRTRFMLRGEAVAVPGASTWEDFKDPAVDPSGRWVAATQTTYLASAAMLTPARHVLVNITTGAVTVLGSAGRPYLCCAAPVKFSGDGSAIVYGVADVDPDGLTTAILFRRTMKTGATEKIWAPAASPCASDVGCVSPPLAHAAVDRTATRIALVTNTRHASDDTDGSSDAYVASR